MFNVVKCWIVLSVMMVMGVCVNVRGADIAGLTHFNKNTSSFSAYRFHDDDPIFFQDGFRLSCRCGETEDGETTGKIAYMTPPQTRFTTYVWVYQLRTER